jgi:type II secretory pathway component HofQ
MRVSTLLMALVFAVPTFADPETKSVAIDDSAKIAEKLLERISLEDQLKGVPLRDALRYLEDKTGLTILVDKRALRDKGDDLAQTIDDAAISLPAMRNVRIETILRKLVDHLDLDYVITPDHVSITTANMKDLTTGQARRLPDLHPAPGFEDEPNVERNIQVRATPYVTVLFKDTAAADALREIAARAGRNVVISQGAAEKAKTAVSVNLSNVAFETAAASLAEAAGLRAFRTGNVVVIVTTDRAKQIEDTAAKSVPNGLGGFSTLPESPANEARVKELDEKVKKLMEDLEKSRKKD